MTFSEMLRKPFSLHLCILSVMKVGKKCTCQSSYLAILRDGMDTETLENSLGHPVKAKEGVTWINLPDCMKEMHVIEEVERIDCKERKVETVCATDRMCRE